nr:MAG TPA: hypothetical protein [Caudoviricetes sp.]
MYMNLPSISLLLREELRSGIIFLVALVFLSAA